MSTGLRAVILLLICWISRFGAFGFSQPAAVLQTGEGMPFISASQPVLIPPGWTSPALQFGFGFASNEPSELPGFFDAATVTVQGDQNGATAILLTVDRNSFQIAPESPGALSLDPAAIQTEPLEFPDLGFSYSFQQAWKVSFTLPSALQQESLMMHLDLFDNLNEHPSLTWISTVAVVPEPGTWGLFLLTALLLVWKFKRRHEN